MTTSEIIAWTLCLGLAAFVAWLVPYTIGLKRRHDRLLTNAVARIFEQNSGILRDVKWKPIDGATHSYEPETQLP